MRALVAVIAVAALAVAGYFVWDGTRPADEQQPVADSSTPEAVPAALPAAAPPVTESQPAEPVAAAAPSATETRTPEPVAAAAPSATETRTPEPVAAAAPSATETRTPEPVAAAAPSATETRTPEPVAAAPGESDVRVATRTADQPPEPKPATAPASRAAAPAPGGDTPTPPTFDVVRISPEGTAVIAGRAEPGAEVTITVGETVIAEVTADARGEWVALPDAPIESGARELALTERTAAGKTVESESVVVLAVPERAAAPKTVDSATPAAPAMPGALAVLVPRESGTSRVLQAPSADVGIKGAENLSLDTIDYDEKGKVALGGRGGEGTEVRVYLDDRLIGEAQVDPQTSWRVEPDEPVSEGLHQLRVEQVDPAGTVVARVETPFSRAGFRLPLAGESLAIVQPGNSLWRIARRVYGGGLKYVVIYEANRDQIGNEDLIYPGQIFVLPRVN